MAFNPKDRFFHKAKAEGFLARSAYKLDEIQKKYRVLKAGDFVIDLGAAPGAWSQVACKIIGSQGHLVGLDLKAVQFKAPNAKFYQMDVFELDPAIFAGREVDLMMSDMAPNTSGVRSVDQARSEALCRRVLELSAQHLRPEGNLIMKLFEGPDAESLVREVGDRFESVKRFKPEAVRKGSFETYIIGMRRK